MLIVENMNSIKKEIKISYNLTIQMAPFTINFLLYFHLVMSICIWRTNRWLWVVWSIYSIKSVDEYI